MRSLLIGSGPLVTRLIGFRVQGFKGLGFRALGFVAAGLGLRV